jgi:hypothetical protein
MKPSLIAVMVGMILAVLPQQAAHATIRGIVVAAGTDAPLAGAQLTLTTFKAFDPRYAGASSEPAVRSVTTDRAGRFMIEDVEAGSYRLTIMRNGYAKQMYGQRVTNGIVPPLEFGEGETKDLMIRLTPAGSISGVVRNASGRPIAGVDVQLVQRIYGETGDRIVTTIASTNTDDRGEYRFYWVSAGRYYVMAGNNHPCRLTPDACPSISKIENYDRGVKDGTNLDERDRSGRYTAAYYPGVRDTVRAAPIDIQPGSELGAIDFTLERLRYHIRGRVIDSTTGQVPSQEVGIEFYELGWGGNGYYDYTPGEVEISNLGPGTYRVRVSLEDSDSGRPPLAAAATKVVIVNSDIDGFVWTLTPSPVIAGRIRVDGDPRDHQELNLPENLDIRLFRPDEPGNFHGDGLGTHPVSLSAKRGAFTLSGIADGEFRVTMPDLPRGFYLKEARLDGVDVLRAPGPLKAGTMELVVSSRGGQIDGIVLDDRSRPRPYVQVVLVPNGSHDRFELFKSATTDKSGRFSLGAIAPGDYKLFAWEALELYSWLDPDVLKHYEGRGRAVHVAESSRQSIEARMIPAGDKR